jgi:hypothetical protein
VLEKSPSASSPVAAAAQSCTPPSELIDGFDIHSWAAYGRRKSKVASRVCKEVGRLKSLLATLELDMDACTLKASHSGSTGFPMERNTGSMTNTEDLEFSDRKPLAFESRSKKVASAGSSDVIRGVVHDDLVEFDPWAGCTRRGVIQHERAVPDDAWARWNALQSESQGLQLTSVLPCDLSD